MTARRRKGEEMVLLPLGGMGEIGMNCYAYGYGHPDDRRWIIVDCGVKFGDERDPGIDVVLPDLAYMESERRNIEAIVLTHAHEDHLGAVVWLWPRLKVPVYCTAFAAELLKGKLIEAGLEAKVPVNVVRSGRRLKLGPFAVEFVAVTHSIPEPHALAITTPAGTVVHSGDLKIDHAPSIPPLFDEERFRQLGEAGVDAFICDSTNVLREGFSPSEADVARTLKTIVGEARGRIAVTTFASHVGRITSTIEAARAAGPRGGGGGPRHAHGDRGRARRRAPEGGRQLSLRTGLWPVAARQDAASCAPAARASRAPPWPASPTTPIPRSPSTAAIWWCFPRAPSPETKRRWGRSSTAWRSRASKW